MKMSNLLILKWRFFEYNVKFERPLLLRCISCIIDVFEIYFGLCEERFEDLQIIIETFKTAPLCPIKWRPFLKFLWNYTKVNGAVLCLRKFSTTGRTWKMMKNAFLFHVKSSFCSQGISIFLLTFWSLGKTAWLER